MDKEYLENLVGPELAGQIWEKHRQELSRLRLEYALDRAVTKAGGRSQKAIRALLDEAALQMADDVDAAAEQAVSDLKRENGWLFAAPQVSSPGTGAMTVTRAPNPNDVAAMSMAEYKRYRQGR